MKSGVDLDVSGERALLLAILEEALACLNRCVVETHKTRQWTDACQREALAWFRSRSVTRIVDFESICHVFGIDPGAFRERVLRNMPGNPDLPGPIVAPERPSRDHRRHDRAALAPQVQALVASKIPLREIASKLGVSIAFVSIMSGSARSQAHRDTRQKILRLAQAGWSRIRLAEKFGMQPQSIGRICRHLGATEPTGLKRAS